MKKADGICPFCHKLLDHDFEKEIRDCFDEAYQDSVDAIATFQSAYTSYTTEMLGVLDENLSNDFPRLDLEMYKEKLERLRTIIQSNLQVSQKKVEMRSLMPVPRIRSMQRPWSVWTRRNEASVRATWIRILR